MAYDPYTGDYYPDEGVAEAATPAWSPAAQEYLSGLQQYVAGLNAAPPSGVSYSVSPALSLWGSSIDPQQLEVAAQASTPYDALTQAKFRTSYAPGSTFERPYPLDAVVGQSTGLRLVDNATGQVVATGTGGAGASDLMNQAGGLSDWTLQSGGGNDWFTLGSSRPTQSSWGAAADMLLPLAASVAFPFLAPEMAPLLAASLGAAAGTGLSGALQGRDIGDIALQAALAGGGSYLGGSLMQGLGSNIAPAGSFEGPNIFDAMDALSAGGVGSSLGSSLGSAAGSAVAPIVVSTAAQPALSALAPAIGSAIGAAAPALSAASSAPSNQDITVTGQPSSAAVAPSDFALPDVAPIAVNVPEVAPLAVTPSTPAQTAPSNQEIVVSNKPTTPVAQPSLAVANPASNVVAPALDAITVTGAPMLPKPYDPTALSVPALSIPSYNAPANPSDIVVSNKPTTPAQEQPSLSVPTLSVPSYNAPANASDIVVSKAQPTDQLTNTAAPTIAEALAAAPSAAAAAANAQANAQGLGTDKPTTLGISDLATALKIGGLASSLLGGVTGAAGGSGSNGTYTGAGTPLPSNFSATLPAANIPGLTGGTAGAGTVAGANTAAFANKTPQDWYRYGYGPAQSFFGYVPQGLPNTSTAYTGYAHGGGVNSAKHLGYEDLSPQEKNFVDYHRRNLAVMPFEHDGDLTTVYGGIDNVDGGAMLHPYYVHGKIVDSQAAMDFARTSGIDFPVYPDVKTAEAREQAIHRDIITPDTQRYQRGDRDWLKGYAHGGQPSNFAVRGEGDGRSDDIPAMLSDGEYVMDAETVALLGNGSNKAGAKRLDDLRVNLRKQKGREMVKGKFSVKAKSPEHYLAGGRT